MFQAAYFVHALVTIASGVFFFWLWAKSGFQVPRYVHVLAILALAAGIAWIVTMDQWGVAKPTLRSWLSTLIFPAIVYIAFVFYGGAEAASKPRRNKPPKPERSPRHPLENKNPFD